MVTPFAANEVVTGAMELLQFHGVLVDILYDKRSKSPTTCLNKASTPPRTPKSTGPCPTAHRWDGRSHTWRAGTWYSLAVLSSAGERGGAHSMQYDRKPYVLGKIIDGLVSCLHVT